MTLPDSSIAPRDYGLFLRELKNRIRQAQLRAALSVNRELVLLYWRIGRDILERQKLHGWSGRNSTVGAPRLSTNWRSIFAANLSR